MEIENPFSSSTKDEKKIADVPKKQTKKILIAVLMFLVVMGLTVCAILSYGSIGDKKENLNSTVDYIHSKQRKLSQENLKDSKANYIEAIYDCPGNNEECRLYGTYEFAVPITYITIDGESFPANCCHKYGNSGVRKVIIKFDEIFGNLYYFFALCKYLISVDFSNFDTSELTNMKGLFSGCTNLKSITWGPNFSTSKVTDMEKLFVDCEKIESIDLSKFNTAKVTNFDFAFNGCESLKELDVSSFDVSSATSMKYMFSFSYKLTSIDLSSFRPSKVKTMTQMFTNCISLKTINFGENFMQEMLMI